MKSIRRIALKFAVAALFFGSAPFASANNIGITLTEVDGFTLTTGSSVVDSIINIAQDHWNVQFVSGFNLTLNNPWMSWNEDGGASANVIHAITSGPGGLLDVFSDVLPGDNLSIGGFCASTPYPLNTATCFAGTMGGDSYFIRVLDQGDVTVPEPASLALLGLGLFGLGFSRRRKA